MKVEEQLTSQSPFTSYKLQVKDEKDNGTEREMGRIQTKCSLQREGS